MKQIISRKDLLVLKDKFSCNEWVSTIDTILKDNYQAVDNIEIDDKYINLLNANGSDEHKKAVGKYGIKLSYKPSKEEAFKILQDIFENSVLNFVNNKPSFYNQKDEWLMGLDIENGYLDYSYYIIYSVFEEKYSYNEQEIRDLMRDWVKEVFKIEGLAPIPIF